jgi:hypothetical protein
LIVAATAALAETPAKPKSEKPASTTTSSTTATTAAPASDDAAPPLTKTVADDPNDSPMVRAAKRAVAARQNPSLRRVVSLTSTGRGRMAIATGPVDGPNVPVPQGSPSAADPGAARQQASVREVARLKAEAEKQKQDKLKALAEEEGMIGAELDEPYGGDIEEDQAEKRMYEIQKEREAINAEKPPSR